MNLQAMKAAALAAPWGKVGKTVLASPANLRHIANCDPQTILKLLAVVEVAQEISKVWRNGYDVSSGSLEAALKELE